MAKGSYTAKIGLDISDVDKKINSLSRELKTIDSDMKTNTSSAELLSQHYQATAEKAKALAEKLQTLQGARQDVLDAFNRGEISSEELRAYEREVESTQQALRDCVPQVLDFSGAFDVLGEALQKVTQLAAAFVQESIEVGKAFESSMSQVAATMGITQLDEEFGELSAKAKDVGATTRYTASQAADALNYLALAGYDAEEAIGAVDSVVHLAQAGGMDLARASDMLTDTISAFGLEGETAADRLTNMNHLVDVMAVTAQNTNTSVSMLGDAFLQLGATGRNIASKDGGVEELATVLGVLANSGIKASEGGTHLRNIMLKISKDGKGVRALAEKLNMDFYDMQGNMKPLPDLFMEMNEKMQVLNLTAKEREKLLNSAFNPTDVAAVNTLLNTTADKYEELAGKINDCKDAAKDMGDTMNDNLEGALRTMQSAKEAVQVELYEKISEPLKNLANTAATALQDTANEIKEAGLGDEFTEALSKISDAAREALPKIMELFKRFAEEVVPKLGDVAVKITEITTDEVLPRMIDLFEWLIDHGNQVEGAIKLVIAAMAFDKVRTFTDGLAGMAAQFSAIATQSGSAAGAIEGATGAMSTQAGALGGGAAGLIGKLNLYAIAIEAAVAVGLLLKDVIDQQTEAMKEQSKYWNDYTDVSNDALDRYADIATGKAAKSSEEYAEQLENDRRKLAELEDQLRKLDELKRNAENSSGLEAWDVYNAYKEEIGMDEDEIRRAQANLRNVIDAEQKAYVNARDEERKARLDAAHEKAEAEKADLKAQEDYWKSGAAAIENGGKEVTDAIKSVKGQEEKVQKEARDSFKAQLDLDVAEGRIKSEEQANEEYINWIKNNLDEGTELYNTEMAKALNNRTKFQEDRRKAEEKAAQERTKAEEEQHKKDVKAEQDYIKQMLHDDENTADKERLSKKQLLELKLKHLNEYKAAGIKFVENEADIEQQILDLEADLAKETGDEEEKLQKEQEKEREKKEKERQDALKKEWQRIDKTDLESQEKFLKSLSLADKELFDQFLQEYEDNLDDLIKAQEEAEQKYIDKGATAAEKVVELYQKQTDSIAKMAESPVETFNEKTKKYEKAEQGTIYDAKTGKKRYIFANYQKKIQELKAYQANLERLKKLDLPQEMITDIFSMDFETRALYIKELLNMSAANREKYFRDYRTFYKTANDIAASEVNYSKKDEVQKIMDEAVRDMSEDQKYNGELAAKSWLEGFSEYMEKNGITLDVSKYTDTVGAYGAANPYAGAMTAEEIKTWKNTQTQLGGAFDQFMQIFNKGTITLNVDGKSMFKGYLTDTMNKTINISDKGGVLT